jgi:ketosteroid isomerase-like protein
MSQQTVDIVGLAHERLNAGDINGVIALCDGDFELDMSRPGVNPETYRRHEAIRRFYREVCEVWEEFRWEPVRLVEASGRSASRGFSIDRAEALEAAGLSE